MQEKCNVYLFEHDIVSTAVKLWQGEGLSIHLHVAMPLVLHAGINQLSTVIHSDHLVKWAELKETQPITKFASANPNINIFFQYINTVTVTCNFNLL